MRTVHTVCMMAPVLQIEVRKADTGQIIFKDNMTASIAAMVIGDYKGGGADQIIVCALNGEVTQILRDSPEFFASYTRSAHLAGQVSV